MVGASVGGSAVAVGIGGLVGGGCDVALGTGEMMGGAVGRGVLVNTGGSVPRAGVVVGGRRVGVRLGAWMGGR